MTSQQAIQAQSDAICVAIRQAPRGLSVDELMSRLQPALDRRTLQRRLAGLVGDGLVRRDGRARATRYLIVEQRENQDRGAASDASPATADTAGAATDGLALSAAGTAAIAAVSKPPTGRKPVGYQRSFLDGYRPNVSRYLDRDSHARLLAASKTVGAADAPAGTYAQQILNRLLIDLSWNSSRLEGNTYSLLDTQRLIEAGETAEGLAATDAQMILNHKQAIEFLVQAADQIGFERAVILNLHALLAENLLPDAAAEGRLRRMAVSIGGSVFHPLEGPQRIAECFEQVLATARAIDDPFEQSFFAMVHLPYLQPFEDVNKRVSRLAANIPLIRHNLSPLAFIDVPMALYTRAILAVYELNRVEALRDLYVWAYERSAARYAAVRQSIGAPDGFRLKHRVALKAIVGEVVRAPLARRAAAKRIAAFAAAEVTADERARFIEVAETELINLTEGNFARYGVSPAMFAAWRTLWSASERSGGHV
jgi:hypothetical protein